MPVPNPAAALFWHTLQRAVGYALLFGVVFLLCALAIYKALIQGRAPYFLFRVLPFPSFFAVYVMAGVLYGYAAGLAAALSSRAKELVSVVYPFIGPTIERIRDQMTTVRPEEFRSILDSEEGENFFDRLALRALRQRPLGAEALERDRLIQTLAERLERRLAAVRRGNVVLGLALVLSPLVLMLVLR